MKGKDSQLKIDFSKSWEEQLGQFKTELFSYIKRKSNEGAKSSQTLSFITWLGGKSKKARAIASYLNKIPHTVFVEVFCGSAVVFFAKRKAPENVLNDINKNLVNLFRVVQDDNKLRELALKWYLVPKCEDEFKRFKSIMRSHDLENLSDVERAFIFLYVVKYAFSNNETTRSISTTARNTNWSFFRILFECHDKIRIGTIILNRDFRDVVRTYNEKNRQVLFFFDPPYFVSDNSYYRHAFNYIDHLDLAKLSREIDRNGNFFFTTYDNTREVRELYKGFYMDKMSYKYGLGNRRDIEREAKSELIISNHHIISQMELFKQEEFL